MRRVLDTGLILSLAREGLPVKAIAARAGCSARTVSRLRVAHGISEPRATRKMTPELLATFEACLDDGWSYAEIIATHHVAQQTLNRYFPHRGWSRVQVGEFAALMHYQAFPRDFDTKRLRSTRQTVLGEARRGSGQPNGAGLAQVPTTGGPDAPSVDALREAS